jgi:SAM-dependent methyltransferase
VTGTGDGESLADYYERRAPHYDAVYAKPERQADLRRLEGLVPGPLADRDVLEIAAGTGYWTQFIAATARTVCATDYNAAPLEIARRRDYPRDNVRFGRADAFALDQVGGDFDACFAGFWWSHVPVGETGRFLRGLAGRLPPGSPVVLADHRNVPGSSQPVTRTDADGNTYQQRRLPDGSQHEILKNFPAADELRAAVSPYGTGVSVTELDYYWLLTFTTAG